MLPKQKEVEVPLLFEIKALGGRAEPGNLYPRVTAHFPQITDVDLVEKKSSGANKWINHIQWVRAVLKQKGELDTSQRGIWKITAKGEQRLASQNVQVPKEYPFTYNKGVVVRRGVHTPPPKPPPPPVIPLPPPQKRHEELKQKVAEIGKRLGYSVKTEQGPMYRHDVQWLSGPYKQDPTYVIEICWGGSLPKDFDSLNWAVKEWTPTGILVVSDDADYNKARTRFGNEPKVIILKAETVDGFHEMIEKTPDFVRFLKSMLG